MKTPRPRIGVTGPDRGGYSAWFATRLLLWLNGAKAIRITPLHQGDSLDLDGLVLGGGADINPQRYKEEILASIKHETKHARKINFAFFASVLIWLLRKILATPSSRGHQDAARDDLEFSLLDEVVKSGTPVLGICRGSQLINVYWGGNLYQSLLEFYVERPNLRTLRPRKLIHIESGTVLSRILGKSRAKVNSLHDQSVRDVAPPLKVSAWESNGVIQAIEHKTYPFMVGVQWHPEFMPYRREQRRLFHHLVEAAQLHKLGASFPQTLGNLEPRRA